MNRNSQHSANPLIAKVQQLFSRDLALENDYLRQENQILRSKLGPRVPLTEADRRRLVKYGLRIKSRLAQPGHQFRQLGSGVENRRAAHPQAASTCTALQC